MPLNWAVLDAESDPFKHGRFVKPFLWGFYDGTTYRTFRTVDETIAFLAVNPFLVYAHNGGKFDYHFMLDKVPSASRVVISGKTDRFDLSGACPRIISGRLAEFRIGESVFRDSYNILPVALKTYQKDDVDYGIFEREEREKPANWKKINDYLKLDCIYLYELIKTFRDEHGGGLTLAGSAMKAWEKIAGKFAPESTKAFYDQVSPWYMGGRVECFKFGEVFRDFNVYDINSAYPHAMLQRHPISVGANVSLSVDPRREKPRETSMYHIMAVADGCCPLRKRSGSLWFPRSSDGEQEFFITGWEYIAGIETNALKVSRIIKRLDFAKTIDFKAYVNHFFSRRAHDKKMKAQFIEGSDEWREWHGRDIVDKTFGNGLYGKFGACPQSYRQYAIIDAKDYGEFRRWRLGLLIRAWLRRREWAKEAEREFKEPCPDTSDYGFAGEWPDGSGNRVLMMARTSNERYYNVATAASITGCVRAKMWRAIAAARQHRAEILYCDTDSLAVVGDISSVIDIGGELGQWKHEALCDYAALCGKKLYAFHIKDATADQRQRGKDWKMAHKGVRMTHQDMTAIAKGGKYDYKPMAPTAGLRGVNTGMLDEIDEDVRAKRNGKKRSKKVARKREGSFVFTTRQVKMTR